MSNLLHIHNLVILIYKIDTLIALTIFLKKYKIDKWSLYIGMEWVLTTCEYIALYIIDIYSFC